jgi:hypothetical protein
MALRMPYIGAGSAMESLLLWEYARGVSNDVDAGCFSPSESRCCANTAGRSGYGRYSGRHFKTGIERKWSIYYGGLAAGRRDSDFYLHLGRLSPEYGQTDRKA